MVLPERYRPQVAEPPLLEWIRRLRAIAQTGLEFADGVFDRERYEAVRRVAAEMASFPGEVATVAEVFAGVEGYATPLLICRSAVFDGDDRILMVREAADGKWTLPGGWIDVGESPSSAAVREVREETGYEVEVDKLAGVYDKLLHEHPPAPHHAYLMFFLCRLVGGKPTTSVETTEVAWFPEDGLPELSTGRSTKAQIERMFTHHRDRTLATDVD